MSRIGAIFSPGRPPALIPYLTAGYPDERATLEAVRLLAAEGADLVELGIPFSDPLADGVTIQKASHEALSAGTTAERCLEMARELRRQVEIPLVFMTYYNPVLRYGPEAFCAHCARAGIDGLIVPDLPPEEGGELEAACRAHGLDLIYLLAPTSTPERIRLVAGRSTGFIYLVSVTGVTGARDTLPPELADLVAAVRQHTRRPVCVGFGISTPGQAAEVARLADGVIVGSRIVQIMGQGENWRSELTRFARQLRQALDNSAADPRRAGPTSPAGRA
ncbi:MAG: tryptophan synthase subunit alpha [Clostridia bacterium]|jgi:tryptophan synthase alpha chain|nr:tryptophan synthase subunit alpha [Clostridia bacterium]MDH7572354.1 tryptophan synthase subunit alpha [Clostridia bacterium]